MNITLHLSFTPKPKTVSILAVPAGIHYLVMERVKRFGGFANGREDGVNALGKMLREYEKEHLAAKDQTDEEYLSKFDDID